MSSRVVPLAALLGAAATAVADEPPATDWREALAAEFESTPPPPVEPALESSPLRPGVALPDFSELDRDVVVLEPMTIAAHRRYRELDAEFARAQAMRESGKLTWKGGPLIERKIGPVRVGVYSVLFVPVAVVGTIEW